MWCVHTSRPFWPLLFPSLFAYLFAQTTTNNVKCCTHTCVVSLSCPPKKVKKKETALSHLLTLSSFSFFFYAGQLFVFESAMKRGENCRNEGNLIAKPKMRVEFAAFSDFRFRIPLDFGLTPSSSMCMVIFLIKISYIYSHRYTIYS